MKIEFCIESVAAAQAAQEKGAHRIELCKSLDKDGLTPSIDLIKACQAIYDGEIHMMIRPKEGDFCYSKSDLIQMKKEIKLAHLYNIKGVVFGVLLKNGNIDTEMQKHFMNMLKDLILKLHFIELLTVAKTH